MESEKARTLKKGLVAIKRNAGDAINKGGVWKMKKGDIINKIKALKYNYNPQERTLRTSGMIRKTSIIKLANL